MTLIQTLQFAKNGIMYFHYHGVIPPFFLIFFFGGEGVGPRNFKTLFKGGAEKIQYYRGKLTFRGDLKRIYSNNYLFGMITSSNNSFDQTIRVPTRSGFSDFVDFVRIGKISQDNHYVT